MENDGWLTATLDFLRRKVYDCLMTDNNPTHADALTRIRAALDHGFALTENESDPGYVLTVASAMLDTIEDAMADAGFPAEGYEV